MKKFLVFVFMLLLVAQSVSAMGIPSGSVVTDMGQPPTTSNEASSSHEGDFSYSPLPITFKDVTSRPSPTAGTSNVYVSATIKNDLDTTQYVSVTSQLFKQSADKYYMNPVSNPNALPRVFAGELAKQQSAPTQTLSLFSLAPGQYRLVYTAKTYKRVGWGSNGSQDQLITGSQELLFTVMRDGVKKGWEDTSIPANIVLPPDSSLSPIESEMINTCENPSNNPIHDELRRSPTQVTLTGTWQFKNRDSQLKGVNRAIIDVYYYDVCSKATDKWVLIAKTNLNENGKYSAVYTPPKVAAPKWKVELSFENQFVRLERPTVASSSSGCLLMSCFAQDSKTTGVVYWINKIYNTDLSNGGNLQPCVIPEKTYMQTAAWHFDDAMRTVEFLSRYNTNLKKAIIQYTTDYESVTNITKFDNNSKMINITETYTSSPNVLIHELGHLYMSADYANRMPKFDYSGNHIMYGTTEPGSAWIEGWAHFISLVVNDSSIFDAGLNYGKYDVENTSTYDNNRDSVEGRVAGALWDLYDKANDGLDTRNYAFSKIYSAMKDSMREGKMINNFSEFWDKWKSLNYDKEAKYSLHQNEIMYLSPGEPEIVDGEDKQTLKLTNITDEAYDIVTSKYKNNRAIEISLYADHKLEKLIKSVTGDDSNPFPTLKDLELKKGQTYYITVSDAIYANSAVSAEIHLKLARSPRPAEIDSTLSPEKPEVVDNQIEKVYAIEGKGQTGSIKTSCLTVPMCSDTFLELYTDKNLKTLVASDDNSGGGLLARISGFTFQQGQTYYVRVRNSKNGQPITVTVTLTTDTNYLTLKSNDPQVIIDSAKRVYKLDGYDGIPIIETSDVKEYDKQGKVVTFHSDTILELYSDPDLKNRIAYDDNSAGNELSRISTVRFEKGKTYYLIVRHAKTGALLTTQVTYRPITILSPEKLVLITLNNQNEQVYAIEGNGQTGSIKTSCLTSPNLPTFCSDTVLELYSDASLRTLVASDDNAEPGNQSRISGFTFLQGQTYYVKVRNAQAGQKVFGSITFTTNFNYPTLKGNTPEVIFDRTEMIYKLEGYEGIPNIETSDVKSIYDHESNFSNLHSDTILELYSDPYLKNRIAYDDNSAGNELSRISTVRFEPGKSYYLRVRHATIGSPLYTQVTYRPFMTLENKMLLILDGDTERVFKIQGANGLVSIKTLPFMRLSDTYLELYIDANLTQRFASDDNKLGNGYAGIDWGLYEWNTVYLKVKSGKDKDRPGPGVTPFYTLLYLEKLPHW